ncbi:MAG TPA: DUF87 domain-containing protein [bacterium]|nr:DUF87 domain-containing protein [bacterium]HPR86523.1 DUF87 domain-containing protein [bacterium]
MADFEKLGMFYLGKEYDPEKKALLDAPVMYDSKDLVTHGVCIGMTGSGKTGLCISLLEEAAIDNIPALIVDPKGDMTNLLLTFPGLLPEEFAPWINEDDARRENQTPQAYAAAQAESWKKGLAQWGEDGDRIRRLRDAADFTIFTPGSTAGTPISILSSFARPAENVLLDSEAAGDLISSTVTSLLGLIGINADPVKSREHILLSNIFNQAWQNGKDLDLATLITAIQNPPFERVGAFAVDTFYPAKERFELALALNNLLAAPGFSTWMEGDPMEIGRLLYTASGKPRHSIFYIAHLSDSERMFFVTLLFNQVVSWMRSQPGTTSLRAILYMDEVAGYLPPVAAPPSKKPLMIMLKQARAYGVGVMLATQNPVDLDYKALSNTGTWFIGRLQTQQDIDKVIEGLRSGAGELDPRVTKALAALGKRVFLMKNIHESDPVIFQSRWALSYLRGPLTLAQIKKLAASASPAAARPAAAARASFGTDAEGRPALPPQIVEYFAPLRGTLRGDAQLIYRPGLLGLAEVSFAPGQSQRLGRIAWIDEGPVPVDWEKAVETPFSENDLEKSPEEKADFARLAAPAASPENYGLWSKSFADALYRTAKIDLFTSTSLKMTSQPGESERDFRIRISQLAREKRDEAVDLLRKRYESKMASLQDRIMRAEQKLEKEKSDYRTQTMSTAVSVGATILGAFFGRKTISSSTLSRAGSAMRSGMRTAKEHGDIDNAVESLDVLKERLNELEQELNQEITQIEEQTDPMQQPLETASLRPKKGDITVRLTALVWLPYWQSSDGKREPCYL